MSLSEEINKKNIKMIGFLSNVICDIEDNDGYVSPMTYKEIKDFFNETDIPENMQRQIKTWEELYG